MAEYKLDLFGILGKIDRGDYDFYEKLSPEEKKEFSPLIFMRWMSGCDDPRQITMLNAFVNKYVFPLGKHPGLLAKTLVTCSSRTPRRYKWITNKKSTNRPNSLKVVMEYYGMSARETKDQMSLIKQEDVLEMANQLGYQKDEVAKLKKEV